MKLVYSAVAALLVIWALLFFFAKEPIFADSPSRTASNPVSDLLVEYPVEGSPFRVTTESPGHVWFTLPEANAIGSLVVTSTLDYKHTTYPIPTADSRPYDLIYVDGVVWFTEADGNKLGRLDVATGLISEYVIPTAGSEPTGLDVAFNGSIWFAERTGNKLGRFRPADTTFTEYGIGTAGALPEDVDVGLGGIIWVTAPGIDQLLGYQLSNQSFVAIPAGFASLPTAVVTDKDGQPWVSAPGLQKIGAYLYGTLSIWIWYEHDRVESGLVDMTITYEQNRRVIWFVDMINGQVGRLSNNGLITEYQTFRLPGPNSEPTGIAVDGDGHSWIADNGRNVITEWRPPYFYGTYLPLVAGH